MTASEMHINMLVKFEKVTSNQAPGIEDRDASIILTNAEMIVIKMMLSPMLNTRKRGLEEDEIRKQGLSALVQTSNINVFTTTADNLPNGVFVNLPTEFMYNILEYVDIDKNNCVTDTPAQLNIKTISHNDYYKLIQDPFKTPYFDGFDGLVWRLTYSRSVTGYNDQTQFALDPNTGYSTVPVSPKRHELITDGTFNVTNYFIRYLKFPRAIISTYNGDGSTSIQVNCELDESIHQAIVDVAVDLLKEAMNQPNQQILPQMQQIE